MQGRVQVLWGLKLICNFGGPLYEKEYKLGTKVNIFGAPLRALEVARASEES